MNMPAMSYQIRVKGHLRPEWAEWFDDMTIIHETDGTTTLSGPVADQAALHGLLIKVRDLGLELLAVTRVEPGQQEVTDASHDAAAEGDQPCDCRSVKGEV
jgi:hypothetical protein